MSNTALQAPAPPPSRDQWALLMDQAKTLVESRFLPKDIDTPAKAAAVMLKGRELGIPAMYALSNIVIINGKPTTSAELLLALIYRDHGDGAIWFAESTETRCTISYTRRGWPARQDYSFTIEDARRAGLQSSATWQKYPAAMLRARCISAVARMAFPDSIGGMHTAEEVGAEVTVDAATGEIRPVPARANIIALPTPATPAQLAELKTLWPHTGRPDSDKAPYLLMHNVADPAHLSTDEAAEVLIALRAEVAAIEAEIADPDDAADAPA